MLPFVVRIHFRYVARESMLRRTLRHAERWISTVYSVVESD